MLERYAIYYAPDPDSDLWVTAANWLGRDAATGELLFQDVPPGLDAETFRNLTQSARRYGFHATLKPPMTLAPDKTIADLLDAARHFAASRPPVTVGALEICDLRGFLALMPRRQTHEVMQLAADCVARFEPFRAPATAEERARRLSQGLTGRQTDLLDQYGYPYVMEEFRMHLTLTDRLPPAARDILLPAANRLFSTALAESCIIDAIAVFRESRPGAPFDRLADFRLTGVA